MLAANYRFKKDLADSVGQGLSFTETSMFGPEYKPNGIFPVVGPSPYVRSWFAEVTMKGGKISKVS